MDDISIDPKQAADILDTLVGKFCSMPVDYSDIFVAPDRLDARSLDILNQAVVAAVEGDSVKAYDLALKVGGASFESSYLRGKILFESKFYFEAAIAFSDAIFQFDRYGEVWFHYAITNYQMGLFNEAYLHWAEAARVNKNHEDARLMLKLANIMTENTHPALQMEAEPMMPLILGEGIDVGCGARKIHPDAIGVDLTAGGDAAGKGGEKGRVSVADVQASGDNLPMFTDGQLDYVIARHNLEHYIDPLKTLEEWTRVLKPGGVIGLVLPDDEAFDTINADETHTHVFTQSSLKNLVSLLPRLCVVEEGICVPNWSFYAIIEKTGSLSKTQYPYRQKAIKLKAQRAGERAKEALKSGMIDIASSAIKKLAELDPGAKLPADPEALFPFPFSKQDQASIKTGARLRVAMMEYSIVTKDWAYTLMRMGVDVLEIPFGHKQKIDLHTEKTVKDFQPDFVVTANYRPHVAESMALFNIPYVCWGIDTSALDSYWRHDLVSDNTHIFHFSKIEAEKFRKIGVKNVTWLPLASNMERFKPFPDNPDFACDISFVGATATVNGYTDLMARLREKLKSRESDVNEKNRIFRLIRAFGTIMEKHTDMSAQWRPSEYKKEIEDASYLLPDLSPDAILFAVGDQITSNLRADVISRLSPLGIDLWGDNWWSAYTSKGAKYRGPSNYHDELPEIYSSSKINIHTNRIYHQDVTPLRIFDVLACKGFLLAEYREAYNDCFEIGKDLICFKTAQEAADLARYYLGRPEERIAIAKSGYEKTVERHSLKGRWERIIDTLEKSGAVSAIKDRGAI
ncbi:hypothetical protein MNBD_NITROSPINAE04-2504 [hydrothermal vent metagenome]|uniref:Methyltransferase type 11 domain-containing protein n=1 Tax=hydrothermal vent metagenome TaxID=652676 RepID=A0A3B1C9J1_9ZZZZ